VAALQKVLAAEARCCLVHVVLEARGVEGVAREPPRVALRHPVRHLGTWSAGNGAAKKQQKQQRDHSSVSML